MEINYSSESDDESVAAKILRSPALLAERVADVAERLSQRSPHATDAAAAAASTLFDTALDHSHAAPAPTATSTSSAPAQLVRR